MSAELKAYKKELQNGLKLADTLASVVLSLADKLPAFTRDTEYIALKTRDVYSFYHGGIASTDVPETTDIHKFESVANEYVSPQSTAKWTKWHRDSYMVGALARFNINADLSKNLGAPVVLVADAENAFETTRSGKVRGRKVRSGQGRLQSLFEQRGPGGGIGPGDRPFHRPDR